MENFEITKEMQKDFDSLKPYNLLANTIILQAKNGKENDKSKKEIGSLLDTYNQVCRQAVHQIMKNK